MTTKNKILLVDDSNLMLRLGKLMLDGEYDVVTAGSGVEALTKAALERPKLILMDVNMPELGGREAADCLGGNACTHDIPVVLMSTEIEARSDGSGRDYLVKPFDGEALRRKVREYVRART
jgi:CheY-like chemotaxis protein